MSSRSAFENRDSDSSEFLQEATSVAMPFLEFNDKQEDRG